jgi:hypothetical protein
MNAQTDLAGDRLRGVGRRACGLWAKVLATPTLYYVGHCGLGTPFEGKAAGAPGLETNRRYVDERSIEEE